MGGLEMHIIHTAINNVHALWFMFMLCVMQWDCSYYSRQPQSYLVKSCNLPCIVRLYEVAVTMRIYAFYM